MKLILTVLAAILFLSACGKKAPLRAPGSEPPQEDARGS